MESVTDFMSPSGTAFDSERPVLEAIDYMRRAKVGAVLVTEGGRPAGMFTERDLLMKADFRDHASIGRLRLRDLMSEGLVTAGPGISCGEALVLMRLKGIRNLPIVEGGEVLGLLSLRSLLDHYAKHLEKLLGEAVDALTAAIGQRDPYTADHQRRVAAISVGVARALGLAAPRIEGLRLAALTHDVGKIDVPIELLAKPGRLTKAEFELIKQHPQAGYAILGAVDFEAPVADIVLQHHERIDGSGYPSGLRGDRILLEARIIGAADVFEAVMSFRPYRAALGLQAARMEIEGGRGRTFDPEVAEAFLDLLDDPGSGILASFQPA